MSIHQNHESSRAGESHPHALTDPDGNVSAHPALIVQPPPDAVSASVQRAQGRGGQSAESSAPSAGDAASDGLNGFALSKQFLPSLVDHLIKPDNVAPSLQPHYRAFYYGLLRPCAPPSVLSLLWVGHLSFSLRIGARGSHVPHKSLNPGHAAFMPDAVWAVSRFSPRLIPG
jgi:hypothetical protein